MMLKPLWLTSVDNHKHDPKQPCAFCKNPRFLLQLMKAIENAHSLSSDVYNLKIVNDIIYAMPTQIVSIFKDYLYYDDPTEYLR